MVLVIVSTKYGYTGGIEMNTVKVIIHFDQVPDRSDSYLIEMTKGDFEVLKPAHGHYLNSTQDNSEGEKSANTINFMLGTGSDDEMDFAKKLGIDESWVGRYKHANRIDAALEEKIDGYISTGFAM